MSRKTGSISKLLLVLPRKAAPLLALRGEKELSENRDIDVCSLCFVLKQDLLLRTLSALCYFTKRSEQNKRHLGKISFVLFSD